MTPSPSFRAHSTHFEEITPASLTEYCLMWRIRDAANVTCLHVPFGRIRTVRRRITGLDKIMGPVRRDAHQVVNGVNTAARADWPYAELPPDTIAVPELSVFILRHFLIALTTIAIGVSGAFAYVRTAFHDLHSARSVCWIDPKASASHAR